MRKERKGSEEESGLASILLIHSLPPTSLTFPAHSSPPRMREGRRETHGEEGEREMNGEGVEGMGRREWPYSFFFLFLASFKLT